MHIHTHLHTYIHVHIHRYMHAYIKIFILSLASNDQSESRFWAFGLLKVKILSVSYWGKPNERPDSGLLGRSEVNQRQGEVPSQQCIVNISWGRIAVARVGRIQRGRSIFSQYRFIDRSLEHECVRGCEPLGVDITRCHLLQETICNWGSTGHDYWSCLHHSSCR